MLRPVRRSPPRVRRSPSTISPSTASSRTGSSLLEVEVQPALDVTQVRAFFRRRGRRSSTTSPWRSSQGRFIGKLPQAAREGAVRHVLHRDRERGRHRCARRRRSRAKSRSRTRRALGIADRATRPKTGTCGSGRRAPRARSRATSAGSTRSSGRATPPVRTRPPDAARRREAAAATPPPRQPPRGHTCRRPFPTPTPPPFPEGRGAAPNTPSAPRTSSGSPCSDTKT